MRTAEPEPTLRSLKSLVVLRTRRIALATYLDQCLVLRYNDCHTSMISSRIGCELAVLTVLCVLMIFFFPAMQGPYSVVHGPVTALQAARAAAHLRTAIVQGAFNSLGNCPISPLVVLSWMALPSAEFQLISLPELNSILRC